MRFSDKPCERRDEEMRKRTEILTQATEVHVRQVIHIEPAEMLRHPKPVCDDFASDEIGDE